MKLFEFIGGLLVMVPCLRLSRTVLAFSRWDEFTFCN